MFKIKLDQDKVGRPIFRLKVDEEKIKENRLIWRASLEGRKVSKEYNYIIPIRFFVPLLKNLNKEEFEIDEDSIESYLEFADEFDGKFHYATSASARYMRNWRELGCPNIYKIELNIKEKSIKTKIAFKKLGRTM